MIVNPLSIAYSTSCSLTPVWGSYFIGGSGCKRCVILQKGYIEGKHCTSEELELSGFEPTGALDTRVKKLLMDGADFLISTNKKIRGPNLKCELCDSTWGTDFDPFN